MLKNIVKGSGVLKNLSVIELFSNLHKTIFLLTLVVESHTIKLSVLLI